MILEKIGVTSVFAAFSLVLLIFTTPQIVIVLEGKQLDNFSRLYSRFKTG